MPPISQPLETLHTLSKTLMDMVFPGKCRLCRRFTVNEPPQLDALDFGSRPLSPTPLLRIPAVNICRHCLSQFSVLPLNDCQRCGCVPDGGVCINCKTHKPKYVDKSVSLLFYDSNVGPVIKRFKYGGDLYMGRFLSLCLLTGLAINRQNDIKYDIIMPVLLHPQKQKSRKFNQNERLLQYWQGFGFNALEGLAHAVIDHKILARCKNTRAQAGLDMSARAENLADAFYVPDNRDLSRLSILVADDIVTTGATVENCAKALKARGAVRVDVVSIARTMPHLNPDHLLEI